MAVRVLSSGSLLSSVGSSIQGSSNRAELALVNGATMVALQQQRPAREVVCMAANKKKAKGSSKKAGGGSKAKSQSHGWSFDALMLVWDEVFDRCCEDGGRAASIRALGHKGLDRFGSGCVLVQETVRTLPRGSASGFSNHARKASDEPPAYETLSWSAHYVPRNFVLDPSLASEAAAPNEDESARNVAAAPSEAASVILDATNDQVVEDVPLVSREVLFSVLRGMDRTRIMGLTGDDISTVPVDENGPGIQPPAARDAGGEEPYNPRNEEIVLMLVVIVDGQPAVGADVVKARPNGSELHWKLEMRDYHTLPIPV